MDPSFTNRSRAKLIPNLDLAIEESEDEGQSVISDVEAQQFLCPRESDDECLILGDYPGSADLSGEIIVIPNDKCKQETYTADDGAVWITVPKNVSEYCNQNIGVLDSGLTDLSFFPSDQTTSAGNFWRIYITPDIIDRIVSCTNTEGRRRCEKWNDCTLKEIESLVGLLYLFGISGLADLPVDEIFQSRLPLVMTKTRFKQLLQFLRFDELNPDESLAPICWVFEKFVANCKAAYVPGEYITIEESIADFRGHCNFIKYLPSQPCKYGIKIWVAADAQNGIVHSAEICCDDVSDGNEVERNFNIVSNLCKDLLSAGRTIVTDNFFTSVQLANKLFADETFLLGKIRSHKMGIPAEFMNEQSEIGESRFLFSNHNTLLRYQAKKNQAVYILSTAHHEPEITVSGAGKATMLLDYNRHKRGIDFVDQIIDSYKCRIIANRWPVRIFAWILDIAALNACKLYCLRNPNVAAKAYNQKSGLRRFLQQLSDELTATACRKHFPVSVSQLTIPLQSRKRNSTMIDENIELSEPVAKFAGRRRCFLCKNEKRTFYQCSKCKKPVCNGHLGETNCICCAK